MVSKQEITRLEGKIITALLFVFAANISSICEANGSRKTFTVYDLLDIKGSLFYTSSIIRLLLKK